MKKTNQITTINTTDTTNTTNTNNTKGEITMKNTRTKKHSFKTRLIATALSAITILSVGAMSFSTASVTASAASIEETGKKIGIDATDAAFDTIADLFPGGKILLSPFQSLFHSGVDDKDPMEIIDEKLDQIDNKLDKLDESEEINACTVKIKVGEDIRDYTFTLSIQDGYRDGDVLIYPELAASVEGPGVNLWDITVQSEDGESITFQALTGATEYMELPFKAFKEEKSTLSISVTARESTHQEFLGEETLTARVNLLVR